MSRGRDALHSPNGKALLTKTATRIFDYVERCRLERQPLLLTDLIEMIETHTGSFIEVVESAPAYRSSDPRLPNGASIPPGVLATMPSTGIFVVFMCSDCHRIENYSKYQSNTCVFCGSGRLSRYP